MGVNVYALGPQKTKMWSSLLPDQHSLTVPPTGTSSAQPHNLWHSPPLIAPNIKGDQQPFSLSGFFFLLLLTCYVKRGYVRGSLPSPSCDWQARAGVHASDGFRECRGGRRAHAPGFAIVVAPHGSSALSPVWDNISPPLLSASCQAETGRTNNRNVFKPLLNGQYVLSLLSSATAHSTCYFSPVAVWPFTPSYMCGHWIYT